MQIDGTLMLYAYKFLSSDLSGARQQVWNHGYRWWSKHGTLDFPLILFEIYEFGPKARPWLPEVPSINTVDSVWLPGAERSIYICIHSYPTLVLHMFFQCVCVVNSAVCLGFRDLPGADLLRFHLHAGLEGEG